MQKKRILVVEDESIVAMDIESDLQNLGYEVAALVGSGEEAVIKAEETRPDLILMDIVLQQKMDGITAAGLIWDKLHIPIVFLTAHGDEGTLKRAKIVQPYGYIVKPFEEADLRAAIELALYRHEFDAKTREDIPAKTNGRGEQNLELGASINQDGVVTKAFDILCKIEPFNRLPEQRLKSFADACQFRQIPAGGFIAYEGESEAASFIVVSGRVAMIKTSPSGKELIVDLLPPGDIFGVMVALDRVPYPLTARAQTAVKILWIPQSVLLLALEDYPELYREFTDQISKRLRTAHDLSRRLAHERVEVRIAAALLALVSPFARYGRDGDCTIGITRQELADLTGTTPETAIRATKAMERKGILDLSKPAEIKILQFESLETMLMD